jgi:hypothetical protein
MNGIELTEAQQQALDSEQDGPPRLIDPRTQGTYVLVKVEDYQNLRASWEEDQLYKCARTVALKNAIGRVEEL